MSLDVVSECSLRQIRVGNSQEVTVVGVCVHLLVFFGELVTLTQSQIAFTHHAQEMKFSAHGVEYIYLSPTCTAFFWGSMSDIHTRCTCKDVGMTFYTVPSTPVRMKNMFLSYFYLDPRRPYVHSVYLQYESLAGSYIKQCAAIAC